MLEYLVSSTKRSWPDRQGGRSRTGGGLWSRRSRRICLLCLLCLLCLFSRPYHIVAYVTVLFALFIAPIYYVYRALYGGSGGTTDTLSENPIYRENLRSGTTSWQSVELQQESDQQHSDRAKLLPQLYTPQNIEGTPGEGGRNEAANAIWKPPIISGYADQTSINHGEAINFYISTSLASYDLEVYRMGWYNGDGARLMLRVSHLPGQHQPMPMPQAGIGLIECNWQISYTLQTDSSWTSGVYLAKMMAGDHSSGYIIFVVRADEAAADILYQIPITTYQAYNNWGGKSLYDFNSVEHRANKVSYDRPFQAWMGAGFFFEGDYNMIRWLESQNYNVTYVTSLDTHTNPLMYTSRKMFLTNWHDEYWSKEMRDNLIDALKRGKHLAFFSADNIYWQIRFEPSSAGTPNRVQVCYKDGLHDPVSHFDPQLTTILWRDDPVNEPENGLIGGMYRSEIAYGDSFPWVVINAHHWIYQDTGLKDGDKIPGLIGYEFDSIWDNGFTPSNLQVLSASPVLDIDGKHTIANSSMYTADSSALVFNAGTFYWSWKLDDNSYQHRGVDRRVQIMTANVLRAMINGTAEVPPQIGGGAIFSVLSRIVDKQNLLSLAIAGPFLSVLLVILLTGMIIRRRQRRSKADHVN